jgi:hypothetical protein
MGHDPGGKVRHPLPTGMTGRAEFSACGRYRRTLFRSWGRDQLSFLNVEQAQGSVLFIGMNPSTADAYVDDPTIRREIGFAKSIGFLELVKCNIGDYRATNPRDLPTDGSACTAENLKAIEAEARLASLVIMAHGVPPAPLRLAAQQVTFMLTDLLGLNLFCFGKTKEGFPKHPLYLPAKSDLIPYEGAPK